MHFETLKNLALPPVSVFVLVGGWLLTRKQCYMQHVHALVRQSLWGSLRTSGITEDSPTPQNWPVWMGKWMWERTSWNKLTQTEFKRCLGTYHEDRTCYFLGFPNVYQGCHNPDNLICVPDYRVKMAWGQVLWELYCSSLICLFHFSCL